MSLRTPTRTLPLLLLGILVVGLGGCKALLYVPEAHVVPLFEAPRAFQVAGSFGLDAAQVQVVGTPLPHVFLFGTGSVAPQDRYTHRFGAVGAGLYAALGPHATVDVLAGMGSGHTEGRGERPAGSGGFLPPFEDYAYEADARRSFVQLNLGRRLDAGAVVMGGALRLSRVRYDNFVTDPPDLAEEVRGVYVEPAWLFRVRVDAHLDLEVQGGYSFAISQEHWELFRRRGSYASGGIRLHLGR